MNFFQFHHQSIIFIENKLSNLLKVSIAMTSFKVEFIEVTTAISFSLVPGFLF